jgi:prepilin-type N-terminal cleavage/methylation domain-containing protein
MNRRFKIYRRRGFVLIEVLFAIFLIGLAALVVAATMPISNVSRQRASVADQAMDVAQKQIEAIRIGGFSSANAIQLASMGLIDSSNPIATNTYSFSNSDSSNLDNPALVLPNGAGTVKIESLNINMTRITVSVSWIDDTGTARTYTLGTLEANL